MQVYKRILVAMDCSPVDDTIVEHVTSLAIQNKSEVILLHVIHAHTLDQDRVLREEAEKTLEAHSENLRKQQVDVRTVFRNGEPDSEILNEIENGDYDLVAMATHGHSFLGDILFGSVSRTLKHKISIPLLLIGPGRKSAV